MSNDNGLISSLDVSATGAIDSNFFIRKGEIIPVPNPLEIISPDTTKVATLSVDNGGSFVLTSNSIALEAENNFNIIVGNATGGGAGLLVKPADQVSEAGGISLFNGAFSATPTYYTTYNASLDQGGLTAGNLQTFGYSGAGGSVINEISNYTVTGSQITLGSSNTIGGTVLAINGFLGTSRVFDEQYNPPPVPAPVTIVPMGQQTVGNFLVNNVVQSLGINVTVTGTYYVVLKVSVGFSDGSIVPSIPAGGILQAWVKDTTTSTQSVSGSEIAVTSAMLATLPTSTIITDVLPNPFTTNYCSGFFTLTAGTFYAIKFVWFSTGQLTFGDIGNTVVLQLSRLQ